jgi:hypothetical protein
MMAFITHFCTRLSASLRALARLAALLLIGAALAATPALAESVEYRDARLAPRDEGWALEADFDIELPARLEDAVNKGLALYFTLDFELTRPRWYWLDEKAVQISQSYRLDYHALTRQYRLSAGLGSLYLSFPTLPDALRVLAQPKIYAAERGKLKPGETYTGNVRLRLDVNRLPKPFQVETLTNREWAMDSDWKKFNVKMPEATAQAQPAAGAGTGATAAGAAK